MTEVSPDIALQVTDLRKQFAGGTGVSRVSMTVRRGEVAGFIGVNGAGKTTTLRCILGLACPDAGSIGLFGRPADAPTRQRIGFLPEERGLPPRERARDAIAFYARLKGVARGEALRRADALLERVGLGNRGKTRIGDLSKGNAQRVQILCALAHEPELLVLDEPFTGLDPVAQAEIRALFAEHRARGGAILFSTHGMATAEALCDRIVILARGQTVFEGALAEATARTRAGAYVTTADAGRLRAAADALGASADALTDGAGGAVRWRVALPTGVTQPALMRALAEQGVPILDYQPIRADLEAVFWDFTQGHAAPVAQNGTTPSPSHPIARAA